VMEDCRVLLKNVVDIKLKASFDWYGGSYCLHFHHLLLVHENRRRHINGPGHLRPCHQPFYCCRRRDDSLIQIMETEEAFVQG
jgi:hypothetical protein